MSDAEDADPVEPEVKLAATAQMVETLRSHPLLAGEETCARLLTTYFDTASDDLRRAGISLRVRDMGTRREQTVKQRVANGGRIVCRREWTVPAAGKRPAPSRLPERAKALLKRLVAGQPLRAVATHDILRFTRRLQVGETVVEVALDVGVISAGERTAAVHEVELELIEGRLSDVLRLAGRLPVGSDLRWSVVSKLEQSYLLARDREAEVVRATPARMSSGIDVATGFQAVAWACLDQLLANYPLVINSGAPEAVHQCRVAIRRLRAAFSLFKEIVDDHEEPVLRAELKAVAAALGVARDRYVLVGHIENAARTGEQDPAELLCHLREQAGRATQAAQAVLASASFQHLLFQLAGWIEDGSWLQQAGERGGDLPLAPFAATVLTERRKALRVRRKLAHMPDGRRHRLRIRAKKLRYGAEFFSPLFDTDETGRSRRSFVKDLGRLQGSLGTLNDMETAAATVGSLFDDLEPIVAAKQRAQLADLLASQEPSRRALLQSAQRTLDRIAEAKGWWKAAGSGA